MRRLSPALLLVPALFIAACTDGPTSTEPGLTPDTPDLGKAAAPDATVEAAMVEVLEGLHARTAATVRGPSANVAAAGAFWLGDPTAGVEGGVLNYFSDRGNKQLSVQYVPGDSRRNGRTDIGYASLMGAPPVGPSAAAVDAAVDRAMATWDAQTCSGGLDIPRGSFLDWLLFDADILHAGFVSLPPGVLGVTIPYVFTSGGVPTDIDNDGNFDYAFAIIYYSSAYSWQIDGNIDVETVVLHEAGHGLGQAHFGRLFQTVNNGKFHFAPRAVMNAGYTGPQQLLAGTDAAGHCSIYGSWPNN